MSNQYLHGHRPGFGDRTNRRFGFTDKNGNEITLGSGHIVLTKTAALALRDMLDRRFAL